MATAKYKVTNVNGYTTPIGNRALAIKKLSWDTGDYVPGAAGGVSVGRQTFGLRGIDSAWSGISASGTYKVDAQLASGPSSASVRFRLYLATTGAEVTATALTADSVTIGVIGG